MNRIYACCAASLGAVLLLCACHKENPTAELEKAAVALDKSEPSTPAPAADATPAPASPPPAQQMREAISEYKEGKMEDAVTRLQLLRATPTLTAEQRMAVQDSVAAVMAEIYSLAEKGDPRAIAAVAQYEKMQTHR